MADEREPIDYTCIFHGKKMSEHDCLYCCLCYRDLTIEECHVLPDGSREDVCNECAEHERLAMEAFHKPMASPDDLTIDAGENGPLRIY